MKTKRPTRQEIAMDIKAIRESCGLTQAELGQIIGVKRSTIACWETGKGMLTADIYKQIVNLVPH